VSGNLSIYVSHKYESITNKPTFQTSVAVVDFFSTDMLETANEVFKGEQSLALQRDDCFTSGTVESCIRRLHLYFRAAETPSLPDNISKM
jgi:hypothetical protein